MKFNSAAQFAIEYFLNSHAIQKWRQTRPKGLNKNK